MGFTQTARLKDANVMRYSNALVLSTLKKTAGLITSCISVLLVILSLLKAHSTHLITSPPKTDLNILLQQLATVIGKSGGLPSWLWLNCPIPDMHDIVSWNNIILVGIYLSIFVGTALYKSGKELSLQIKEADKQIKVERLKRSLSGEKTPSKEDIKETTRVEGSSMFQQIHQLYLAPVLTAVIITIIVKLLGI